MPPRTAHAKGKAVAASLGSAPPPPSILYPAPPRAHPPHVDSVSRTHALCSCSASRASSRLRAEISLKPCRWGSGIRGEAGRGDRAWGGREPGAGGACCEVRGRRLMMRSASTNQGRAGQYG
jgi:hypothetical protein